MPTSCETHQNTPFRKTPYKHNLKNTSAMKIATTNAATIKRPRTITPADKGVPPPGQLTGVYDDIQNTTRPPPTAPSRLLLGHPREV